jgi:predicted nucleic acid-binding protein
MAAVAKFLADTSAIARYPSTEVAARLTPLLATGLLATCGVVDLELLYSARDTADYSKTSVTRRSSFQWLPTEDVDIRRALEIQAELAKRGQRRIAWPDLVIAAVAERHRVAILHYDADYDAIAEITGQNAEWVVPKGSVS